MQKGKTKAGPAGSLASMGEPQIPSRPGRAAVKVWLYGQISEPIPATLSSGPSTPTWSNPQPERAGHSFLPMKAAAISKQVLWLCKKDGNFTEDQKGGGEVEGVSNDSRAF